MMTDQDRDEFERLVSSACERPLTAAELARMDGLLATHAEARREWLDACRVHVELGLHMRADAIAKRLAESARAGSIAEAGCDAQVCEPRRFAGRRGRWAATLGATAAGIALLWNLAGSVPDSPAVAVADAGETAEKNPDSPARRLPKRRPEVVAIMHRVPSRGGANSAAVTERVVLAGEEIDLDTGSAHLEMTGGARLSLEAPAKLRLVSADRVRLFRGSLSANLSEWAEGFIVDTNAMRLTDLGTTFAVTAEAGSVAEAHVLQGLVKVQPRELADDSLRGFLLNEGESVRVEGSSAVRNPIDLSADAVRRKIAELQRLGSYQPIPCHNTGVRLQQGEEDPFWRITAASDGSGVSTPRYAVVCKPHDRYSINEPTRSQWVSVSQGNERLPADACYTFRTTIDLTGYDLASVRLIGQVLADNGVRAVRLNGVSTPFPGWNDNVHLQEFRREEFHVIELSRGFVAGENTLEFDVWNGGEFRKSDGSVELAHIPNPMALRVEWQAFGQPLAEG